MYVHIDDDRASIFLLWLAGDSNGGKRVSQKLKSRHPERVVSVIDDRAHFWSVTTLFLSVWHLARGDFSHAKFTLGRQRSRETRSNSNRRLGAMAAVRDYSRFSKYAGRSKKGCQSSKLPAANFPLATTIFLFLYASLTIN